MQLRRNVKNRTDRDGSAGWLRIADSYTTRDVWSRSGSRLRADAAMSGPRPSPAT